MENILYISIYLSIYLYLPSKIGQTIIYNHNYIIHQFFQL